jgi:hypothetical protein
MLNFLPPLHTFGTRPVKCSQREFMFVTCTSDDATFLEFFSGAVNQIHLALKFEEDPTLTRR